MLISSKGLNKTVSEKEQSLKELQTIPGVGRSIANDLYNIGVRKVSDLRRKNPERLYQLSNQFAGVAQDHCLLYVFRCAVYFAETPKPDKEKLQWWWWKDIKNGKPNILLKLNDLVFYNCKNIFLFFGMDDRKPCKSAECWQDRIILVKIKAGETQGLFSRTAYPYSRMYMA